MHVPCVPLCSFFKMQWIRWEITQWLWDCAYPTGLRKILSRYAGIKISLSWHWVAKTRCLFISTAPARVVGVFTGLNLSSFSRTSSWKAKSRTTSSRRADFALDSAANRAPGFLALKSCFPGWMTIYLNISPVPTVIPWHLWIVVPHDSLNGTQTHLHRHGQSVHWCLENKDPLWPQNLKTKTRHF